MPFNQDLWQFLTVRTYPDRIRRSLIICGRLIKRSAIIVQLCRLINPAGNYVPPVTTFTLIAFITYERMQLCVAPITTGDRMENATFCTRIAASVYFCFSHLLEKKKIADATSRRSPRVQKNAPLWPRQIMRRRR